ncbi:hypothetical protein [Fluviicola taffensis]|uniref:Uncharacterized protein n=1 Tax=Fluviicola taffensis (strain DSM 16823 / NCIMB 13979 / RW262) TaxID=755732 RepID=F2IA60_FLUTR|nr:hypothetical protein [Fluviicola taffensis]AEA45237.1 hypothetical protein Fluta_3264 [Fluviicola taffensis DSM 16823]
MLLNFAFIFRQLAIWTFLIFSSTSLAQEQWPALPSELPLTFNDLGRFGLAPKVILSPEGHVQSYQRNIQLQRENELKRGFNNMLFKLKKARTITNEPLLDKLFLFQTREAGKDIALINSSIYPQILNDSLVLVNPKVSSIIYDGVYQRDILRSSSNDSVQISNWYVKRFSAIEIAEISKERQLFASKIEVLNRQKLQRETSHQNWYSAHTEIENLEKQIDPLMHLTDSIDFLLYPSIYLELEPWYKQRFPGANNSEQFDPFLYFTSKKWFLNSVNLRLHSDPFLKQKFVLSHVLVDDPYVRKFIYLGDSTAIHGQSIFGSLDIEAAYSFWDDPHCSYFSLHNTYLIIVKTESNIGETYEDYKFSYYVYEVKR